jgi:hypothetical protein
MGVPPDVQNALDRHGQDDRRQIDQDDSRAVKQLHFFFPPFIRRP